MTGEGVSLTDHEGALLALVLREQPITAYRIRTSYEASPVTNLSSSTGQIYPLIRRMKDLGFLAAEPVPGDRRGTENLFCTASGVRKVREWLVAVRPSHLLLEDPLRTKLQSFGLLTPDEQIAWIVEVKSALSDKLQELADYEQKAEIPFKELVSDNAVSSIRARMDWLDRVLRNIVRSKG